MALFDFDQAVNDKLGGANVDVVPAAAVEVFHKEACMIGSVVESEAGALQAAEEIGVTSCGLLGGVDVDSLCYLVGVGHGEHVGVFDRWLNREMAKT